MMFEAFGFMQESSCTAEKPSQLPSVGKPPLFLIILCYQIPRIIVLTTLC